jgi:hypothetical protein
MGRLFSPGLLTCRLAHPIRSHSIFFPQTSAITEPIGHLLLFGTQNRTLLGSYLATISRILISIMLVTTNTLP